jgi:hypothetical protein
MVSIVSISFKARPEERFGGNPEDDTGEVPVASFETVAPTE